MKKIVLCSLFLLCSCSSVFFTAKKNENCLSDKKYRVFQVIEEGALARGCNLWGKLCDGIVVLFKKQSGVEYYEGLLISVPKGSCAVPKGVHTYTTVDDYLKTVPVIHFESETSE